MARPPGKPFEGASGNGRGFSQGGPYLNGSNVRQFPKQPPMGAVEPSYDPNARPASATRKVDCAAERVSLPAKAARRYDSFLKQSPAGTHNDAMWYARASKEQRRAYKAARRAS